MNKDGQIVNFKLAVNDIPSTSTVDVTETVKYAPEAFGDVKVGTTLDVTGKNTKGAWSWLLKGSLLGYYDKKFFLGGDVEHTT